MFDLHPSAIANYNEKAESLISLIEECHTVESKNGQLPSDIYIAANIEDKDLIGSIEERTMNHKGKVIECFFRHNKKRYGIVESSYKEIIELAERIQRTPQLREKLSTTFIENHLFIWAKNVYINGEADSSFIEYLHAEANKSIQPITIFVPLANIVVQTPFSFCGIVVRTITKQMVDNFFEQFPAAESVEEEHAHQKYVEQFRADYQGYGAVEIDLHCEPTFAQNLALEKAGRVCDLLGIYFGYVFIPDIKCPVQVKGMEGTVSATTISLTESRLMSISKQLVDQSSISTIVVNDSKIIDMKKAGLDVISKLENKIDKNDFERCVLNMAYLYSKAAFTSDPMEKLVYILSSLESTLLKSNNEPIQQNLAERMALVSSDELSRRKKIIKNVKFVYGLRSRYLHHGQSSTELSQLASFLADVWVFYLYLLSYVDRYSSKEEFLDSIEDKKLT